MFFAKKLNFWRHFVTNLPTSFRYDSSKFSTFLDNDQKVLGMRVITHNLLQCHVKDCKENNYPLGLEDIELETEEAEFNQEFIEKMITRMDWKAFVSTALTLGITELPEELPETLDTELAQKIHKIAMEHKIKNGKMVCNGCGHIYPINEGIPNMLLSNDEV